MREYLFKGRSLYIDDLWVYGSVTFIHSSIALHVYIVPGDGSPRIEVVPGTVCMWIGEYDINDVKIFEDDIVKIHPRHSVVNLTVEEGVVIDRHTLSIKSKRGNGSLDVWRPQDTVELEVIGNIHDKSH